MRVVESDVSYLEVLGVGVMSGQLGELAHGFDTDNALQSKISLQCKPAGKVVGGNCSDVSFW